MRFLEGLRRRRQPSHGTSRRLSTTWDQRLSLGGRIATEHEKTAGGGMRESSPERGRSASK